MATPIYIYMKALINFIYRHVYIFLTLAILLLAIFLRCFAFTATPTSLYWDEASILYDTYSLAQTGADMHAKPYPLISFTSFGDQKPSGYYYTLLPFVSFFGPSNWVVKIPSLLAGILIVWGTGLLFKQLFFRQNPDKQHFFSLLAMLIAALNPSLIHLSRVGFETNLGLCFLLFGLIFGLRALRSQSKINYFFLMSELFFFAAFYTYHSYRFLAPVLGLYLFFTLLYTHRQQFRQTLISLILVPIFTLICLLPLIISPQSLTSRLSDTTIFNNLDTIILSNQCYQQAQFGPLSPLLCHRYRYFGQTILQNYVRNLNPLALFFQGDGHPRHSANPWGFFYPVELLFCLIGLIFALIHFRSHRFALSLLFVWLILTFLPSSLTYDNPHLLRSSSLLIIVSILATLGIYQLTLFFPKAKKIILPLILLTYFIFTTIFFLYYHQTYRHQSASYWQDGYQEAIEAFVQLKEKYPTLPFYITNAYGRASIYYFLYAPITPEKVQAANTERMQNSEFESFENQYSRFGAGFNSAKEQLVIITPEEKTIGETDKSLQLNDITPIYNHNGELVFIVAKAN